MLEAQEGYDLLVVFGHWVMEGKVNQRRNHLQIKRRETLKPPIGNENVFISRKLASITVESTPKSFAEVGENKCSLSGVRQSKSIDTNGLVEISITPSVLEGIATNL